MENTTNKVVRNTTVISKPKFLPAVNKHTKLSVQIQQKSANFISEYQEFLKEVAEEQISAGSLVSAFINSAVMSDKSFIEWRKKKTSETTKTTKTEQVKANEKTANIAAKENKSSENPLFDTDNPLSEEE
jgi:hypothetical protein